MRTIKFRAWNKVSEEMTYFDFNSIIKKQDALYSIHDEYCNSNVTMQYTGLKDKNGKEIYEGDILKSNASYDRVFWNEDKWSFEVMKRHDIKGGWIVGHISNGLKIAAEYNEVIGNIYENPELIK
jgi:uncharacterized phage protein (TIGR01671 family)